MSRSIALLLLLLAIGVPAGAQVIPPGQEQTLAAMLGSGAALPNACSFADGLVDRDVVRATYHCADGDVVIQLAHPSAADARIRTKRFALTVVGGAPHDEFLKAIEARIRAKESAFEWSMLSVGKNSRPSWVFALVLLGLAAAASVGALRAWDASRPAPRAVLEAVVVAVVVVLWLQRDAGPPAHMDTAVDVALARDCIASKGASCLGHAASAIGLVQGQAFTYGLALWLYLGWSMRALCFVAACVHGATAGLLHQAIRRRFGGVAWAVSAFAPALGVYMTGYPTLWNPSWFVLPLSVAFLAVLALADGAGTWAAFLAGVAVAITGESHVLFGPFVAVVVVIGMIAARRPARTAAVLLAGFLLTEVVVSPVTSGVNAIVLDGWVRAHRVAAAGAVGLLAASVPLLLSFRRALRDHPGSRELVAVAVWLSTAALGLGLVLPWAASRPPQVRYYGAAFPAIVYAAGWLLHAVTARARPSMVTWVAGAVFAAIFTQRVASASFAGATWFMDDGLRLGTSAALVDASALDIQLVVRPMPRGALGEVAAAFVGNAGVPTFPPRIVRAVRPPSGTDVPDGWTRVDVARGEILTSEIDAWTHPEEAGICPDPPTGDPCISVTRDDFGDVARDAGGAVHRLFGLRLARTAARIREWNAKGARSLLWSIPLRRAGSDETHEIVFSDAADERIVGVEGTRSTSHGDDRAAVERPPPGAAAFIKVSTPIADKFEAGVPPLPIELRESEVGVLSAVLPVSERVAGSRAR